jgi:anthranilate phosphoribosyltransferase
MTDNAPSYRDMLGRLLDGESLTRSEAHATFMQLMDGELTEAQIAGLLVALAAKGESVDEIAGAAQAMREHAVPVDTGGQDVIDIVGTGGTGLRTFNISTTACMVCAGAGLKVAKHGNRTNTRASGSADVLAALGVNLDATPDVVSRCLAEANVCFCFAVKHHPAMKYAVPVRKQLAVRTIFNVLGPLTNPAGAKYQLMGVFDAALTETLAKALGTLGVVRAMVVHADDGLDELSTISATQISELRDGQVTTRHVEPEEFGLDRAKMDDLLVDSPEQSGEVIRAVLGGEKGPARDIVVLNAAAALVIADKSDSIAAGIKLAAAAIDNGAATASLDKLIKLSNE